MAHRPAHRAGLGRHRRPGAAGPGTCGHRGLPLPAMGQAAPDGLGGGGTISGVAALPRAERTAQVVAAGSIGAIGQMGPAEHASPAGPARAIGRRKTGKPRPSAGRRVPGPPALAEGLCRGDRQRLRVELESGGTRVSGRRVQARRAPRQRARRGGRSDRGVALVPRRCGPGSRQGGPAGWAGHSTGSKPGPCRRVGRAVDSPGGRPRRHRGSDPHGPDGRSARFGGRCGASPELVSQGGRPAAKGSLLPPGRRLPRRSDRTARPRRGPADAAIGRSRPAGV
jgi:hypothetical protein